MGEEYILALDQGSTTSRAILFDRAGQVKAAAQEPLRSILPRPGWVEHDAQALWESAATALNTVLQAVPEARHRVVAMGIANQRETVVAWDKRTGQAVAPAISWQCRRTADLCQTLKNRGLEAFVRQKTGLPLDPYFSATKIHWLFQEHADLVRLAKAGRLAVGTVDSWLLFQLSGGQHLTDVSNAARTLLMNLRTLSWDQELLDLFEVPSAILPEIVDSAGIGVPVQGDWFSRPVPVLGILGDQQASLFGHGCLRPGMVKSTYGTGAFVLMNTGMTPVASPEALLSTVAWRMDGVTHYALEGSVFSSGSAVEWLRDNLKVISDVGESEALAQSVEDTAGVYFVPAFVGLGAPYWDSYARGTVVGLTRGAQAAHLVRAVLEASAFQTRDIVETMAQESGYPVTQLSVDGGMSRNRFFSQFQADILGVPVAVAPYQELTALGAAAMAAHGLGWDVVPWMATSRASDWYRPTMEAALRDRRYREWKKAVARARNWAEGSGG
ncbi:MAG: glycerol kinase GlpK [Firmicutes bacterium]|nr:glycerol kinase GlpK [Bacillota bacterium]